MSAQKPELFKQKFISNQKAHSRGKMIWESAPESILIIRKLDLSTTQPFIQVNSPKSIETKIHLRAEISHWKAQINF